jgi:competence protein ComEA
MKNVIRVFTLVWLLCCSSMALAGVVNINTADAQSLAGNISGVGIKRAQAIIDYRDAHGPFKSVDDLTQVKGIGSKLLERNRENLVVSEETEKAH